MAQVTCWTGTDLRTQPWVAVERDGTATATFVVGVWSHSGATAPPTVSATYGSTRLGTPAIVEITAAGVDARRKTPDEGAATVPSAAYGRFESVRHLFDVAQWLGRPGADGLDHYYEVTFRGLAPGGLLRLTATVDVGGESAGSGTYGLWVVDPRFDAGEVVASDVSGTDTSRWWILMRRRDEELELDHFRIDLMATRAKAQGPDPFSYDLPEVVLEVDGRAYGAARPAAPDPAEPFAHVGTRVDRSTDSVHVVVPGAQGASTVRVSVGQHPPTPDVVLDEPSEHRPVAMMIIGFAIQGLNDLFVDPVDVPGEAPRSFGEIVWRDEQAVFSGRPEQPENHEADGYAMMLEAQRDYRVPAVWAFNAGVLQLLRGSLHPEDFQSLVDAVADGLVSPANAGYGAHRGAYYRTETNVGEIEEGARIIETLLRRKPNGVYFGDSRIYQAARSETEAFARLQEPIRYLVMDRSTIATADSRGGQRRYFPAAPPVSRGNYLWRDAPTGLDVLLIEDVLRGGLLNDGEQTEHPRGSVGGPVRELLMGAYGTDDTLAPRLFVVADDIEHFSGAGWFDGGLDFAAAFRSVLCWVNEHPWVQTWVPDDPQFASTFRRTDQQLRVSSAVDPTMDPEGAESVEQGAAVQFDLDVAAWRRFPVEWLGCTLDAISEPLEAALAGLPPEPTAFERLARLYFLGCTHEGFWSKHPEEHLLGDFDLDNPFRWDPEDFVVSQSVQVRNAWVYLNAAVWAALAPNLPAGDRVLVAPTPASTGADPLLAAVRERGSADRWWEPGVAHDDNGLYWDHDNLPNVILYNADVLAVVDTNGGVVTQLFARVGGKAISVSGTTKAYQFLTLPAAGDPQIPSDGPRVQNTVFTPNHSYVGSDVRQAGGRRGSFLDQHPPGHLVQTWYPNNHDRYHCEAVPGQAAVRLTYERTGPPMHDLDQEYALRSMIQDGERLRAGQPGIVWHDGPEFSKTIALQGRTLTISYAGVQPDHVVANEFTVDLLAQLVQGAGQTITRGDTRTTVRASKGPTSAGDARDAEVTVRAVSGCRLTDGAGTEHASLAHRVLTDAVLVVPVDHATDFTYTIDLPG